tara:strand:- start:1527 stop:1973 length:447 start_codon:yes stop_codon:yes gene_type:complete
MNIETLKRELIVDEGVKYEVYLDHLGYKTFGIGHLCKATDPENDFDVGQEVSKERVDECFLNDVDRVIEDCIKLYEDFYTLPDEAQLIIANMMFNLGRPRLSKFIRMRENVINHNWKGAETEMRNSKWFSQVPNRAERLCARMGAITV